MKSLIAKTASARQLVDTVARMLDGRSCPRPELSRHAVALPGAELLYDVLG